MMRRTHPDFADGVTEAFVSTELVERHGVELAFVQVGHRTFALLLTQRAAGVQRVLEAVSKKTRGDIQSDTSRTRSFIYVAAIAITCILGDLHSLLVK